MTAKILLKPSDKLTDIFLTAVIEQETDGKYQAIVLGFPECQAEGNTREDAIANLSQLVTNRLEKAELISLEIQEHKPDSPALTILIEQETEGKYQAVALGWEECKAEGNSREEVITNISRVVGDRLEKSELISLAIQPPKPEHPWMKFAGMFQDDPQFDEMLEDIQQLRRDRDAEMEEYYRKMDAEEAVK
jgi:predicted RNase H-like HicB family nuclease